MRKWSLLAVVAALLASTAGQVFAGEPPGWSAGTGYSETSRR